MKKGIFTISMLALLSAAPLSSQVATVSKNYSGCAQTTEQLKVGAFLPDQLDSAVTDRGGPTAKYPIAQMRANVTGKVSLQFVVDTNGKAISCSISVLAATDTAFVASAMNTIIGHAFSPGILKGAPVRALVSQTISYTLGN